MNRQAQAYFQTASSLLAAGQDFVVVTWVKSEGHAPQDEGAKAIVGAGGLLWGTVGGGKVEAQAIRYAQENLARGGPIPPAYLRWDLQRDVGMSCGGVVHFLFETMRARPWSIAVFGAGHVAQALVRNLALLDCAVTVVDTRPEWLAKLPQSEGLRIQHCDDMASFAADLPMDTYCVLVTKGHDSDVPVLKVLLKGPERPYLGVIGSKVKARALRAELLRAGFDAATLQRFRCPMGLTIASHQPAEIALSIAAELVSVKNRVKNSVGGETLKDKEGEE